MIRFIRMPAVRLALAALCAALAACSSAPNPVAPVAPPGPAGRTAIATPTAGDPACLPGLQALYAELRAERDRLWKAIEGGNESLAVSFDRVQSQREKVLAMLAAGCSPAP